MIDSAIASLRPNTIIADLSSLQLITPNLDRYPQLKDAIVISTGCDKKKHLKAQAAKFKSSKVIGRQ